jgi:hypothetical protein
MKTATIPEGITRKEACAIAFERAQARLAADLLALPYLLYNDTIAQWPTPWRIIR